ncbi:MAG: HlyD family efflux transporter periplasmic adaptor subunit [Thermoflexales bacterium]|nr:HlyD family efflux transporter periplasmic adaptor subunit [Thermoflexales bacterium]
MKHTSIFMVALVVVLAACGQAPTPTPEPITQDIPPVVSASGKLVPEQWATLSFQGGGQLVDLRVQMGDAVKAGDVLAQLDDTDAEAVVTQAEAALAVAQAQLAQLKAGPQPGEIAAAEQAVKSAEAAQAGAEAQLRQLQAGSRAADIAAADAALAAAFTQRKAAQDNYDRVDEIGGWMEEELRFALEAAKKDYAAAEKRLQQVKAGATQNERDAAQANVAAAQAQVAQAQAQLDLVKAGATREQIAVAEAGVAQAQVAVDTAKGQLPKLVLAAPFDGTLGAVMVRQGEWLAPGQALAILGELDTLRVEVTDLSELDVARVSEGQPVKVTFDALKDVSMAGKVMRIAPMSTPGQSGVNYLVWVELEEKHPALRWGMTAFVDVQVE